MRHGSVISAPAETVACTIAIGVWVLPGPLMPSTSPAMTRMSAPASCEAPRPTSAAADVLVVRRQPLVGLRQVDPELEAVEQAALGDEPLRRGLDVQQAAAGGHPLGVAVGDGAAAAVAVLVVEDAVDHVGDGLEAAVRVPRRALGLAGRVLDLTHLVHVDERVEAGRVDAGERAADGEALPLVALRRGGDADRRAVLGVRVGAATVRGRTVQSGTVTAGMLHSFVWSYTSSTFN